MEAKTRYFHRKLCSAGAASLAIVAVAAAAFAAFAAFVAADAYADADDAAVAVADAVITCRSLCCVASQAKSAVWDCIHDLIIIAVCR